MLKIEFLKKSPEKQCFSGVRKCRTLTNSDFRVCESLELSPICTKKIHTACVLGHQRAYRLSSGTPDARFEHYLQQMGGSWGRLKLILPVGNPPKKINRRIRRIRSHRRQHKPRLTAHAFRMTLVAQGKLPQTITITFKTCLTLHHFFLEVEGRQ